MLWFQPWLVETCISSLIILQSFLTDPHPGVNTVLQFKLLRRQYLTINFHQYPNLFWALSGSGYSGMYRIKIEVTSHPTPRSPSSSQPTQPTMPPSAHYSPNLCVSNCNRYHSFAITSPGNILCVLYIGLSIMQVQANATFEPLSLHWNLVCQRGWWFWWLGQHHILIAHKD
jgi:hypothetical protein